MSISIKSISPEILSDLKLWFNNYVKTFKTDDAEYNKNIILKEEHTKRVCAEIIEIGMHSGLNDEELSLAEITALLHDVGRFEQYARYGTFADSKSEDHGALGIRITEEHGILKQLDDETKNVILSSVKYHNRAFIPSGESETILFYSRLVRDADKLDILRVVTEYYHRKHGSRNGTLELDLPDTPGISQEVYRDLMNRKIVDIKNLKNLNDFKLFQIGWIFDINFNKTRGLIKERGYFEKIRDALPKIKEVDDIFQTVYSFFDQKAL